MCLILFKHFEQIYHQKVLFIILLFLIFELKIYTDPSNFLSQLLYGQETNLNKDK
jgi:hypothetical protein